MNIFSIYSVLFIVASDSAHRIIYPKPVQSIPNYIHIMVFLQLVVQKLSHDTPYEVAIEVAGKAQLSVRSGSSRGGRCISGIDGE